MPKDLDFRQPNLNKKERYQFNPGLDRETFLKLKRLELETGLKPRHLLKKIVDYYFDSTGLNL